MPVFHLSNLGFDIRVMNMNLLLGKYIESKYFPTKRKISKENHPLKGCIFYPIVVICVHIFKRYCIQFRKSFKKPENV